MIVRARFTHLSSIALAVGALGCSRPAADDDGSPDAGDDDGDGDETTGDAQSSSSGADGSSESGGSSPSSCGDPLPEGIALRDVSLFQTIGVPLVENCVAIAPAERLAPIVAGRIAMARATVLLGDAWAPTDVRARVDLESSAGSETVEGPCTRVDAGTATAELRVEIPAASIATDTRYSMSVTTCDGDVLGTGPDGSAAELGAETTGIMRLHLVPFEVGGFVPDTSQAVLDGYGDALLAHYPVTDVVITVGPVEPDDNAGVVDMGALLVRIVQIQEADLFASGDLDPAKADIYYYGLVTGAATRDEFCDDCPTGTSEAGGGERAGSSVGAAFADALSESTLVHEMGHLHGLLHSPCGDPDLQDPDYPYVDGATHTEGWDVRTGEIVPPTHNDLMGYCQPRWVSDYHYRKLVDWVQLAASWGG